MALRNVFTEGEEILRKKARDVNEITPRILTLLEDMKETMEDSKGVGIAAPQVGVSRKICIVAPSEDRFIELINPEILEVDGEQISLEGCLSVPDMIGEVKRPKSVKIRYKDREFKEHIEVFEDFEAVVVSHELDHLEGVLYTDKAKNIRPIEAEEE